MFIQGTVRNFYPVVRDIHFQRSIRLMESKEYTCLRGV